MPHGADRQEVILMAFSALYTDFKQFAAGLARCGNNRIIL